MKKTISVLITFSHNQYFFYNAPLKETENKFQLKYYYLIVDIWKQYSYLTLCDLNHIE